jgi:hypothetical protein
MAISARGFAGSNDEKHPLPLDAAFAQFVTLT